MIAEKLLACATPAPVDPGSTLFLSNWATTGVPTAQVGTISPTWASVVTPGVLDLSAGYVNCKFAPPASDDWVVDMFFDGPALTVINSMSTPYLFYCDGFTLYLSDSGLGWTLSITQCRPPCTRSRNSAIRPAFF